MNRALLVLDQNVSNPASFLGNGFAELNVAMPENSQNMRDTFVNQVSNHSLTTGHALHPGGPRFGDCGRSLEILFHNLLLPRYSTVSPRRHGARRTRIRWEARTGNSRSPAGDGSGEDTSSTGRRS